MLSPRNDGPMYEEHDDYTTCSLTHDLVPAFALEMRVADVRETVAALGVTVREALDLMVDNVPGIACVFFNAPEFEDGVLKEIFGHQCIPLALYGVLPHGPGVASPFMLGCDHLANHPVALQRYARDVLADWKKEYRHLFNWVHAENTVAIRWLELLGFSMQDPAPYGARGELFRRFDWKVWVN